MSSRSRDAGYHPEHPVQGPGSDQIEASVEIPADPDQVRRHEGGAVFTDDRLLGSAVTRRIAADRALIARHRVGIAAGRHAAAADRLEVDPERLVVGSLADEIGHGAGRVRAGHDAFGDRLGKCAHHQVGDALAGLQPAIDRRGVGAVEDAALARSDPERPRQPGIGRDRRIEHRLHDVVDGREQRGVGHVDAGAHLVRRVEGECHRIALHRHLDGQRQVALDLLVVEHVLEAPGAVGHGRDRGAHLALGVVHQRRAGPQHGIGAVFGAQRLEALHAHAVGCHLGAQVRQPLARHLAVEQDQILDVGLKLAGAIEPHRRNAQALLEDVGMAAVDEVCMVSEVHRPGHEPSVDEDRLGQHDVGQVGAAALVGIVADEGVARPYVLDPVAFHDVRHQLDEAAEMDRDVLGLAERLALGIEQRRRAVAPLLDIGRVRNADQRLACLLDDRVHGSADHLDGNGIQGHDAVSRIRFRYASTRAVMPGGTRVVASICSTTAGPAKRWPGCSASRA